MNAQKELMGILFRNDKKPAPSIPTTRNPRPSAAWSIGSAAGSKKVSAGNLCRSPLPTKPISAKARLRGAMTTKISTS
jgi:hypothetical protein